MPDKQNFNAVICIEGNGTRESHRGDGFKESETMYTLNTVEQHAVCVLNDQGGQQISVEQDDVSPTLRAQDHGHPPTVCYGLCSLNSNSMKSDNPHSGIYEADTTRTLDNNGGNPNCNQGGMLVVQDVCLGLDRASFNQGQNAQYDFQIDNELAQTIVAKGAGGVLTRK